MTRMGALTSLAVSASSLISIDCVVRIRYGLVRGQCKEGTLLKALAERVGFEPTIRLPRQQPEKSRFDYGRSRTSPFL